MQGHNNKLPHGKAVRVGRTGAIFLALLGLTPLAFAKPGGEPLVLDTETGIHSGVPGTVLQTAPLGSSGMVPMQTLPGLQQSEQQPIVVSPYVEYGGQTSAPASNYGYGNGNGSGNGGRNRAPRTPSGQ